MATFGCFCLKTCIFIPISKIYNVLFPLIFWTVDFYEIWYLKKFQQIFNCFSLNQKSSFESKLSNCQKCENKIKLTERRAKQNMIWLFVHYDFQDRIYFSMCNYRKDLKKLFILLLFDNISLFWLHASFHYIKRFLTSRSLFKGKKKKMFF